MVWAEARGDRANCDGEGVVTREGEKIYCAQGGYSCPGG